MRTPKTISQRTSWHVAFRFKGTISNNVEEGKTASAKLNNSDCLIKYMSFGLDIDRLFAPISFFFKLFFE